MKRAMTIWRRWFYLLAAVPVLSSAQDPQALLARARAKVAGEAGRIPRFVCRQKIERRVFAPEVKKPAGCAELIAERQQNPPHGLRLSSMDQAKLDVMLSGGRELFSWPGQHRFDADSPASLLAGGMAGSGDFASFRLEIFTKNIATARYLGPCEQSSCLRFAYEVPQELSHYVLRTPQGDFTAGYEGTFDLDSATAEILALTIIGAPPARPDVCTVQTRIEYAKATAAAGDFMIPAFTEKDLILTNGGYYENKLYYEACKQYSTESVVKFGDDSPAPSAPDSPRPAPIAPAIGTELQLRFISQIDSKTSFAGDSVEAVIVRRVRDSAGLVIPANTVVRGHIAQAQRLFFTQETVIALRFDAILLAGAEIPVALEQVNSRGVRQSGKYVFEQSGVTTMPRTVTLWRVISPRP